jgi:hypothetical protein
MEPEEATRAGYLSAIGAATVRQRAAERPTR